jgi:hypothetical protein
MTGSLRRRGPDSWEPRIYLGVDADTGKERWATKTVHGSRRYAGCQLAVFVEEAGFARLRAGTAADLLERWLTHASPAWSSTTLRETRSVIEHHLKPFLGQRALVTSRSLPEVVAGAAARSVAFSSSSSSAPSKVVVSPVGWMTTNAGWATMPKCA